MDTDYLDISDFYLEDNKIRLKMNHEIMNKSLVLFIDQDNTKLIKKFKELLGYKCSYLLAIVFISPKIQKMIDDSDDFIVTGDIIFYYQGKYKEKIKIQFENNLRRGVDRLEKSLGSTSSTNSTNTEKEDDSN